MSRDANRSNTATIDLRLTGIAPSFQNPEQRLSALAGTLALRASEWGWAAIYERWRAGKPVSPFHRKFLAVSSHYRVLAGEPDYDHLTIASIRALPERSR